MHGHLSEEPVRPGTTTLRGSRVPSPTSVSFLHCSPHPPNPPQAVWYLKCRALTLKNWIDDAEIEEEVRKHVDQHRLDGNGKTREVLFVSSFIHLMSFKKHVVKQPSTFTLTKPLIITPHNTNRAWLISFSTRTRRRKRLGQERHWRARERTEAAQTPASDRRRKADDPRLGSPGLVRVRKGLERTERVK